MLHYKNLYNLFFESFPNSATDFVALTGYVGPDPIRALKSLPFESKVIFGLFKENQKVLLHNQLVGLHSDKHKIFYPDIACHSKCYIWLKDQVPIKGLIGSANFSSNGLLNDYRESLLEVDQNQLFVLKGYIEIILNSARECTLVEVIEEPESTEEYNRDICDMVLYDPHTGQTQLSHGLNWGLAEGSHVRTNDACIPIRTDHIRKYPKLFPLLQPDPERTRGSLNEVIEIVWDDGLVMKGRLEGSQPVNDQKYPKQIASFPHKDEMGKYFRDRLGIEYGIRILREDLVKYGRDYVSVSLIEEGVYYFDFSPNG
ncbi:NgoFVII family restriction endonuclease [bacterium AH-315-C07]|nr:NgoFVII family restriction endonuclease [bacterium AH-315-C07]